MNKKLILLIALVGAQATVQAVDMKVTTLNFAQSLKGATIATSSYALQGIKENAGQLAEFVKENPGTTVLGIVTAVSVIALFKMLSDIKKALDYNFGYK